MSLGFLTESALIPRKSKDIKVDKSAVVGLKSVIAEQERKQEGEDESINPRKRTRRVTNPKPAKKEDRNPGIDQRIRRDEEEIEASNMRSKLKKLEEKVERFQAMQRGEIQPDSESLIDFSRRKQMYDYYEIPMAAEETAPKEQPSSGVTDEIIIERYKSFLQVPHKPDDVLIEDEFGRIRWVARGSTEHMKNIGSSYRIRNEMSGSAGSDSKKMNEKPVMSKAARVKMTWEQQLVGSEREYFDEIDKQTEAYKQEKQRKQAQEKQAPKTNIRSRKELAEDMLRALL